MNLTESTVIDLNQAAELAGVCWNTIAKMATADDDFPGRKFGTKWRINKKLFLLWIGNVPRGDWPKFYEDVRV